LQSEEARKQIILIVAGPAAGKTEAFPQPQHRLETRNGSPHRVEGLETADLRHVLFHAEVVALNTLLKMFCA
jgi:hypothetical protein